MFMTVQTMVKAVVVSTVPSGLGARRRFLRTIEKSRRMQRAGGLGPHLGFLPATSSAATLSRYGIMRQRRLKAYRCDRVAGCDELVMMVVNQALPFAVQLPNFWNVRWSVNVKTFT